MTSPSASLRSRRSLLIGLATLLPVLGIMVWLGDVLIQRPNQPVLRVAIRGYDPRDLLRGHYINFQLDLPSTGQTSNACFCLVPNPDSPLRPKAEAVDCKPAPARAQCPYFLHVPYGSFQYFMAEDAAKDMDIHLRQSRPTAGQDGPPQASVKLHFQGNGRVSFSDLRLETAH